MTDAGRSPIVGVVLAGGQSRRMDGREKALIELAGRPLIAHAIVQWRIHQMDVLQSLKVME